MSAFAAIINAPDYAPRIRHQAIFEAFDGLSAGETLLLVNDHEPRPLYYQFQAERPGQFAWEYVEEGPELYRVAITKLHAGA